MELSQVHAVITGGASGLGYATAEKLLAAGARVTLLDVNVEQGEAAAQQLGAQFLCTDVTDEALVAGNLAKAAETMGGLNLVVSCAGILGAGRVLGKHGPMPLNQFESTLRVNLVGSFNVAKAAAHIMQNNAPGADGERGLIVNTASVAAYEGQIGQAAYAASKGGVISMTLPLARELARFGIRVMTVAPGIFVTPMAAGMPAEVKASLSAQVPFPARLGEPSEFADMVAFIVTSRYLNGGTLRLDGAVRLQAK